MFRRLLVILAAVLAKLGLLVLPLVDIVSVVMGAAKESVAPIAGWTGLLALGLAVYFVYSVLADLLWGCAAWLGKDWGEEFSVNWRRGCGALLVVLLMLVLSHPLRAWHYLLGLVGRNELTETALLVDGQITTDHHLLVMAFAVLVAVALPPLRVFIHKAVRAWQAWVAGVFLVVFLAWLLPVTGRMLRAVAIDALHAGNGEVLVGRAGWLYERRELNALTGAAVGMEEVSRVVLGFARDLKERGVPLLLIPLPMKASIYPEGVTGDLPEESPAPVYHGHLPGLFAEWSKAGIDVQDLTAAMMQAKEKKAPVFMKQSSFWTAEAMEALAKAVAAHVRKTYPQAAAPSPMIVDAKARDGFSYGHLVEALEQVGPGGMFSPERSVLLSFPSIEPDRRSAVVLLGGSAVALFDDHRLGYVPQSQPAASPMRASFSHHLALYLGKPLDGHIEPGGAATECRRRFAQEPDDQVRAKKLVIWVLPVSDILLPAPGEWQSVTFSPERTPPETLLPMAPGQK